MDLLKRTFSKNATISRTYAVPQSEKSMADDLKDVGKDIIDYSPMVQQEKDSILLQNHLRAMIKEKVEQLTRWSNEGKSWIEKYKNGFENNKDGSYQSYSTTLELLKTTVASFEKLNAQFDESKNELDKVLETIPKKEKRVIKSECSREQTMIVDAKQEKNNVEQKVNQNKTAIKQNQNDREKKSVSQRKRAKLDKQLESLQVNKKQLKKQLLNQERKYGDAIKMYEDNMREIYDQSYELELARLEKIPDLLTSFIVALKIDKSELKESITKHDPKTDLSQWRQKHFPQFNKKL